MSKKLLIRLVEEHIKLALIEDRRGALKKFGLPPSIIEYFHNFYPPLSYKFSDWIVKSMMDYGGSAKQLLDVLIHIYKTEPQKEQTLLSTFKQMFEGNSVYPNASDFKRIFDWVAKKQGIDLSKFSYASIRQKIVQDEEVQKNESGGQIMKTFSDGFYWINLNVSQCDYEAGKMGHCGTDERGNIWSLRDKSKAPHITATVDDKGVIHQLKGKENTKPVAKYHKYIAQLLADANLITGIKTGSDSNDFSIGDLGENGMKWVMEKNPHIATSIIKQQKTIELWQNLKNDNGDNAKESVIEQLKKNGLQIHRVEVETQPSEEDYTSFYRFNALISGSLEQFGPETIVKIFENATRLVANDIGSAGYFISHFGKVFIQEEYNDDEDGQLHIELSQDIEVRVPT